MEQVEGKATLSKSSRFAKVIDVVCAAWMVMHVYAIWRLPFSIDEFKVLHLGVATSILFFRACIPKDSQKLWSSLLWMGLAFISLFTTFFFYFDYENMVERVGVPSMGDVMVGTLLVVVVIIVTWRVWGFIIPLLSFITILYGLFGHYLEGFFYHSGIDFPRLTGYLSTYFMGTLGSFTGLSATLIIHFLLFGALLQVMGGAKLIEKLSIIIGSRFRSGAPQTAVVSSLLFGMISGSTAANVATTGAFTIPLMKRRGYHPDFAGAVEAVASTGGQIMPPVMGVSAFIIASLTDIPYVQIAIAAFLPALVYYGNLSFAVWVRTRKRGFTIIKQDSELPVIRIRDVLKEHGHLVIPVAILTWRIFIGETPAKAVLYANLSLVALGLISTIILGRRELGKALIQFGCEVYKGLVDGAREGAKLGVILASMGIIIEMFTVTGFGQRLSHTIVELAGGQPLLLIFLAAILCLFFGMGMPTPGAYLLTVLLSAPVLIKVGFPVLSVHMFVFYFAIISAITPPVAIGALVAVGISGGKYLGTALHAMRLALPGFLLPFYFLYMPVILDLIKDPLGALEFNAFLMIAMFGMCIFFEGFFLDQVGWLRRGLCFVASLMIFHPSKIASWVGTGMLLLFGTIHFFLYWRLQHQRTQVNQEGVFVQASTLSDIDPP
jgi:TRAP transporter 4TM/12TM fusion protein